ncbi:hypothetical protein FA13DRAFT_255461 [Coprinellus micaceus]|uniref:Uncharacterized protein n=1 Tax=Coprinellus micaceus TaxID=71717 RepID=A0A4Y7TE40_COPMI|nr:hypothetical protein FA13DRAFT_590139 [Coprinellus micaceus]TEB32446.1 hypothetical protein FA13DRAFT_255461 [Coprinellus micaceus]
MCLHRAGPAFPYSCQKVDLNEMFQEDDDIEDDSLGAECKIGLSAAVRGAFHPPTHAYTWKRSAGRPYRTTIRHCCAPYSDPISTFETQGQPGIPHLQRRLGKSLPLSHHQNVPRFLHTRPTTWRHPRQFGIRAPGLQIKPRKWTWISVCAGCSGCHLARFLSLHLFHEPRGSQPGTSGQGNMRPGRPPAELATEPIYVWIPGARPRKAHSLS